MKIRQQCKTRSKFLSSQTTLISSNSSMYLKMKDIGALLWSSCREANSLIKFQKKSSFLSKRQGKPLSQLQMQFITATPREFCTEILNQRICFCNQRTKESHHSKQQTLDQLAFLMKELSQAQPVEPQDMQLQKYSSKNLMGKNVIFGVLVQLHLYFCQEPHHFMKKTILHFLSKSRRASTILKLRRGTQFQTKQRILFRKFQLLTQLRESQWKECKLTPG